MRAGVLFQLRSYRPVSYICYYTRLVSESPGTMILPSCVMHFCLSCLFSYLPVIAQWLIKKLFVVYNPCLAARAAITAAELCLAVRPGLSSCRTDRHNDRSRTSSTRRLVTDQFLKCSFLWWNQFGKRRNAGLGTSGAWPTPWIGYSWLSSFTGWNVTASLVETRG